MTEFLLVLNLILLVRLFAYFGDGRFSGRAAVAVAIGLPAFLFLVFDASLALWLLQAGLASTMLLGWLADRPAPRNGARLTLLLIQVTLVGFATSEASGLELRHQWLSWIEAGRHYFPPWELVERLTSETAQARLAGLLACLQEANLAVRWILEALGLKPRNLSHQAKAEEIRAEPAAGRDDREYRAGRVIGTLERVAVYVLVLHAQYEALGLVLAAKGLARFQNLDEREFAEYFLIGTFLSVVLAGAAAMAVQLVS